MKLTIKRKNLKKRQTTYRNTRQFTEAFTLGLKAGRNQVQDEIRKTLEFLFKVN